MWLVEPIGSDWLMAVYKELIAPYMHHTCTVHCWEIGLIGYYTFLWSMLFHEIYYLTLCTVHVWCMHVWCMYGAFWGFCTVQIVCCVIISAITFLTNYVWQIHQFSQSESAYYFNGKNMEKMNKSLENLRTSNE